MRRAVLACAATFAWPALAYADIYKCTDAYVVAYQSAPCAPGQVQTVVSTAKRAAAPTAYPSSTPAASTSAPRPRVAALPTRDVAFKRTAIALGVSDDEVLNMPGWGKPARIERSREGRVYRESWRYDMPNGDTRWLYFANARLTGIEVEPPRSERFAGYALR